jgi:hypothetical protein
MRYYPTLHLKEQWLVRKDMDVNEHEILSNFTLKGTVISKKGYGYPFLLITVPLSVTLDSISYSFTSISFLTTSCFFTLICV